MDYRICIKCGLTKELVPECWHKSRSGYRNPCKSCRNQIESERKRAAYALNPEKFKKASKAQFRANPAKVREYKKISYHKNKPIKPE